MITEEINYFSKIDQHDIKKYKECLDVYSSNFENITKLDTKLPIFLDTNILLRYYSISFSAREKLFAFFKDNKNRIVITKQVQKEFIKNREEVIQKFFKQVTNRIPGDFKSEIVNKLKNFLDQHKVVLKDYPYVEKELEKHKVELEEVLEKLNTDFETKSDEYKNLIWKDEFLDLLNEFQLIDNLNEDEVKLVISKFDLLKRDIGSNSIDAFLNKPNYVFPGMCDIKEKPDNPYGDFIILHEMMKYIIDGKTDVIFLTFDNSKGDWMSKNKTPYLHYIQNVYLNTNQIIYILDADRTLEKLLSVDIDSLLQKELSIESYNISVEEINNIFMLHPVFENVSFHLANNFLLKEICLNGYENYDEIWKDLDKVSEIMSLFKKEYPKFNTVGILRYALKIANINYKMRVNYYTGKETAADLHNDKKVLKYRALLELL